MQRVNLSPPGDAAVLQMFEKERLIESLKQILSAKSNDLGLMQSCFITIKECFKASPQLMKEIVKNKIYKSVVNSFGKFPKAVYLVHVAMDTLVTLAESDDVVDGLIEDRSYSVIVQTLQNYQFTHPVLRRGMKLLSLILEKDCHACGLLVKYGDLAVFASSLGETSIYKELVIHTLAALKAMGSTSYYIHKQGSLSPTSSPTHSLFGENTSLLSQLVENGVMGHIENLTVMYQEDEEVVLAVCTTLEALTLEVVTCPLTCGPRQCLDYVERPNLLWTGLPSNLIQALMYHVHNPDIQCNGLRALTNLIESEYMVVMETTNLLDWLTVIRSAMNVHHSDNMLVQVRGAECLAALLKSLAESKETVQWLHKQIGGPRGDRPSEKFPLLELLKVNLGVHRVDWDVFEASCKALYYLMDGVGMKKDLLDRGTDVIVLDGIKHYFDQPPSPNHQTEQTDLLFWGIRTLRVMTVSNKKQQIYLQTSGCVLQLMYNIAARYSDNALVLQEAFSIVACFASGKKKDSFLFNHGVEKSTDMTTSAVSYKLVQKDIPPAAWLREKAIELNFHGIALESVDIHIQSQSICEVILELLIVLLSQYSETSALLYTLCELSTAEKVAQVMLEHMNHYGIQQKAYLLIRILCSFSLFRSTPEDFSLTLARALVKSLLKWKTEQCLLEEGLLSVHLCCSTSEHLSACLVEESVHLILVDILQRDEDEVGIVDEEKTPLSEVATSVIYTLCCERNYCNQLLVAMVKDKLLEGVRMLVDLGADVNFGEEPDTPICLAVAARDRDMVEYFLTKDVSNVTRAISIAEEQGDDVIMSHLLAHFAQTSANDALCLSELNLSSLRSHWLLPLFEDRGDQLASSASSSRHTSLSHVAKELRRRRTSAELRFSPDDLEKLRRHCPLGESDAEASGEESDSSFSSRGHSPRVISPIDLTRVPPQGTRLSPVPQSPGSSGPMDSLKYSVSGPSVDTPDHLGSASSGEYIPSSHTQSPPAPMEESESELLSVGVANMSVTGADLPWNKTVTINQSENDHYKPFLPPSPEALKGYYEQTTSPCDVFPSKSTPYVTRRTSFTDASAAIKVLNLSCNQLQSLSAFHDPKLRQKLQQLKDLNLSHNSITSLTRELFDELMSLKVLNVSHNCLVQFPLPIFSCSLLKELDLSHNNISTFLPPPVSLPHLEVLRLNNNKLLEYPAGLTNVNFPNLTKVFLDSNQISGLPLKHLKLEELRTLSMSKNALEHIPRDFLSSLKGVRVLNLSKNTIVELPSEAAGYLAELEELKVSWNRLGKNEGEFYAFVTQLPKLRRLDATNNELTTLAPPWQWLSRGLKELFLSNNLIDKIDLANGSMHWPVIERLHLGHNKLKAIPKEVGFLRSLCTLDISNNVAIAKLPNELGNLNQLYTLDREGLVKLDPSLLDVPTKTAIAMLKSRLTKSVPYHCMKLMFIGGPGRGKTSLLQCVLKGGPLNKKLRQSSLSTLGVQVIDWKYTHRSGDSYHLKCWDFAGQEDFYSTHQCFLTPRSVYVLVYDFNRGLSELDSIVSWLLNINARAPQSQVIIVGTHKDLVPSSGYWPRHQEMRSKIKEFVKKPGFPHRIHFHEVSCVQDRSGVKEFITTLKDTIDRAKLRGDRIMGGLIPCSYLTLAEIVEEESKRLRSLREKFPVMHHCRLQQLMEKKGLFLEKEELQQAIKFLHDSGLVLHYMDLYSKLSDLYFLDPEWLCQLMGQIISVPEVNPVLRARKGRLELSDFDLLLRPPTYPSEYRDEYVRLLERFEVAIRQTSSTVLIPSHLPANRPDFTVPSGPHIVRRYQMCYIPPGFWPRLSTRLLAFHDSVLAEPPCEIHVWNTGVCTFWSAESYYEVTEISQIKYTIDITVATSRTGVQLLCSVIDNIEALIDEWFPGLRDVDTTCGDNLVKPYAVCPNCTGPTHLFDIDELVILSATCDDIMCPVHKGKVPLENLAPEVMISDLDPQFKLHHKDIKLSEVPSNSLGKGGFGEVYKAQYKGKPVAIKMFSKKFAEINGTTPNHLLRQEVIILSQMDHPNIIKLVGVSLRPQPLLVLEYAEYGSLQKVSLESYTVRLKHSIAVQIASGLAYLHKHHVIYRDLKPDNILVFSPNISATVNVKMSDYGISRYATVSGLKIDAGTVGNKAPEQLRARATDTPYDEKVDIFSYGLLLFYLITNGHRPFEDLTGAFDKERAFEEGYAIRDVEQYGCPPWPDMQELIKECLQYRPYNRPSAQAIFEYLCDVDFVGLKKMIPVHKDTEIECSTTRVFRSESGVNVEVWVALHVDQGTMCSITNLSVKGSQPAGMAVSGSDKVMCMITIMEQYVAMGTQNGKIIIFNARDRTLSHVLCDLGDAVICMLFFKCPEGNVLCAGLADGRVVRFTQAQIQADSAEGEPVNLNNRTAPVKAMKKFRKILLICVGAEVVFVGLSNWTVMKSYTFSAKANDKNDTLITHLEVGMSMLWTAHRRSPSVHLWDVDQGRAKGQLVCDVIVRKHHHIQSPCAQKYYISSMMLQVTPNQNLWVGLTSGHMILFNASTRLPLIVTHRHCSRLSNMLSFKAQVMGKEMTLVVTGGFGFEASPNEWKKEKKGCYDNWGCLLVWDSAMVKQKPHMEELLTQQLPYK
jgi:leucine-rich repeat kinase 2